MDASTFNWWPFFYGAIIFQGVFLGIVLLATKKGYPTANRYLAAMMFIFSLALVERVISLSGLYQTWPHLLFVSSPFWFMLPPLYYFYARSFTGQSVHFSPIQLLHVVPVILVVVYFTPYYLWSKEMKLIFIQDRSLFYNHEESFIYSSVYYIQSLGYLIGSIFVFGNYGKQILSNKWLLLSYSALTLYVLFNTVQSVYYFLTYENLFDFKLWGTPIYAVVIFSLAYFALIKPEMIFVPSWKLWQQKNGRLSADEMDNIITSLRKLMQTQKLYLNCDLKYSDVAAGLGISVRSLSDALNEHAGLSFNDFVNEYRIHEAKQFILKGKLENETMLAVALNSGFKNKSSFNRVFKNQTGQTPTEFLQSSSHERAFNVAL
ncbi:helix-turn-helix domain-containing protein [bacterium]|nr:helix-turn-helix domain-containing protein [bacterium]